MIDFTHISDQRQDYWGESLLHKGVMEEYNAQNYNSLKALGEKFGLPTH